MIKNSIISLLFGVLILFGCSENKKKNEHKDKWEFVKTISLDDVYPIGIAAQGNFLWISDVEHNRIVKINHEGKVIEEFDGFQRPMHLAIQDNKIYIPEYTEDKVKILEKGKVSTYFLKEKPDGVGGIIVRGKTIGLVDFYNHRIILQQDNRVSIIGKKGHNDGELFYPTDIDIESNLIYVADAYNNRVQVFDFKGKYVKMIGWNENIKVAAGIKVTENQVVIADFEGNRVLIYDHNGKLLQTLSDKFNQPTDIEIIENTMFVINYKGSSIAIFGL